MSLIDHPNARHAAAVARGGCGSESGSKRDDHNLAGDIFVASKSSAPPHRRSSGSSNKKDRRRRRRRRAPTGSPERRGSAQREEKEPRPRDHAGAPGDIAPSTADDPAAVVGAPGRVRGASVAAGQGSNGSRTSINNNSVASFVVPRSSSSGAGIDVSSASQRPSCDSKNHDNSSSSSVQHAEEARTALPTGREEVREANKRHTDGGDDSDVALHGDPAAAAAVAAVGARPDGRRGNSRGAPEGTGHGDGLDGTARRGGVGGGGSRRGSSNSEDMEFPIQSQALPDWADTIKVGGLGGRGMNICTRLGHDF